MTKPGSRRYGSIARAGFETARQTTAVVSVVVYEIWNGATTMLLREIKLPSSVLLDMIMLYVRMRSEMQLQTYKYTLKKVLRSNNLLYNGSCTRWAYTFV